VIRSVSHSHHRQRRRPLPRTRPVGLFRFRTYFLKLMYLFRQLVGLLGWGISWTQGLYLHCTTQHWKTWTHIHASSGIQAHDPSVQVAEDSMCLRPCGHWDQHHFYVCPHIVKP